MVTGRGSTVLLARVALIRTVTPNQSLGGTMLSTAQPLVRLAMRSFTAWWSIEFLTGAVSEWRAISADRAADGPTAPTAPTAPHISEIRPTATLATDALAVNHTRAMAGIS